MKKVYTETFQQHVDSITNLLFKKSSRCELTDDEKKLVKLYLQHERNPTWRPIIIDGIKTIYTIDEFGHVKNTYTNLIRNPAIGSNGYAHIGIRLYNNKTIRIVTCSIHRLVAEAFIPNPENKPQVNHINGIKTCNWVGNLEWVTAKENSKHAFDNGLHVGMPGVNSPVAIYSEDQIREVCRLLEEAKLTKEAISKKTGVSRGTVTGIAIGKRWNTISKDYNISFVSKPRRPKSEMEIVQSLLKEGKTTREILNDLGWENNPANRSFINFHRINLNQS